MAAEYGININVRTRTEALKRLQSDLKNTDAFFERILKKVNDPALKGRVLEGFKDKVAKLRNEVIILNNGFVNNTNRVNDSAKTLKLFSQQLRDARKNTKLFSGEYKVLTQGIQKADFTARFKDLKEFSRKAAITAGNLGGAIPMARGTGFEDLMAFRPTQTRKAINEYLGFLRDLEAKLDRTSDRFKEVTQRIREMERELNSPVIANATAYSQPIGPRQAMAGENFFNRTLGRNRQFQEGGMFYEPGGFGKRRRNALSSGLIGGGFPLLFGQGFGASVGGGIGGIAGGFLGGGLGFGLSIVGTQLGKQFDLLAQKAKELGEALRKPTENIDFLIQSIGEKSTPFGDTVQTLKELGLEGPAAALALDQFNKKFKKGSVEISQVGSEFLELQNQLGILGTTLGILVAGPLGSFIKTINEGLLGPSTSYEQVQDYAKRKLRNKGQIFEFQELFEKQTGYTRQDLLNDRIPENVKNSPEFQNAIRKILDQTVDPQGAQGRAENEKALEIAKRQIKDIRTFELQSIKNKVLLEKQSLDTSSADLRVLQEKFKLEEAIEKVRKAEANIVEGLSSKKLEELTHVKDLAIEEQKLAEQRLANAERLADSVEAALIGLRKEMAQLNDAGYRLVEVSKAISNGFSESFKGIVNGTMTAQQALANFFQKVADSFLDMAAQMIAKQIQMRILGIGLNFFGSGGKDSVFTSDVNDVIDNPYKIPDGRASGGPVSGGRSYIVGEKGPEVFTPGISGGITPNHALGGSTNISVNIDASGTSVQGDEPNGEELGRLVAAAIQSELIKEKRPGGLLS